MPAENGLSLHRLPLKIPKGVLPCYVYAVFCLDKKSGAGFVKFGISANIFARLGSLRTACPIPAEQFAIAKVGSRTSAMWLEQDLHRRFHERRSAGEWFRFDFSSVADKEEFNRVCKAVFRRFGIYEYWTKFSAKALEKLIKEQRRRFLKNRTNGRMYKLGGHLGTREYAWKELEKYGTERTIR